MLWAFISGLLRRNESGTSWETLGLFIILSHSHRGVNIRKQVSLQMNGFSLYIITASTEPYFCWCECKTQRASVRSSPSGFYKAFCLRRVLLESVVVINVWVYFTGHGPYRWNTRRAKACIVNGSSKLWLGSHSRACHLCVSPTVCSGYGWGVAPNGRSRFWSHRWECDVPSGPLHEALRRMEGALEWDRTTGPF